MNLKPKEIVKKLDQYIIGQDEAKKSIAIALRNRYRRMLLPKELQDEVVPKNILMIGSTGVGKTEIARRLAKMLALPFVKVEASKYTEVGFVGRDVESMVRDLVVAAINLVKKEHQEKNADSIEKYVEDEIIKKLVPPLPKLSNPDRKRDYEGALKITRERLKGGELDDMKITVEIVNRGPEISDNSLPPEIIKVQESFVKILGNSKKPVKKEISVKEARDVLRQQASDKLIDHENIKREALKRAENQGIIFIDEIDKVAVSKKSYSGADPSKEGVQRDLLPIVEGSNINTKYGIIKSDHILFIAAGAFHISKPSDLIPELQGRLPLRVELDSLNESVLYKILTTTKNSLLKQYESLLKTENVTLVFEDRAIRAMARISNIANEKTEDIGARRLHTVIEKVIEDISYRADESSGETVTVTEKLVYDKLNNVIEDEELAKYIL